jgi:hypothetical protein
MPQFGGSQVMLFVSRPIGLRRSGASTFGVRYERAYARSSDPAMQFCAPVRHYALVELQLVRGSAARFQFGSRVTWDLGRRQLGPTALQSPAWSMPAGPALTSTVAAWVP